MSLNTAEPITHNLLRNSQIRKNQSLSRVSQPDHMDRDKQSDRNKQQHKRNQKYNFNYSQSSVPSHFQKKSLALSTSYQPEYSNHKNCKVQKHSIVVCNSLPKTRPKYSFSFGQVPKFHQEYNQTMNKSSNFQAQNSFKSYNNFQIQNKKMGKRDIRKDMDLCIYTITDKLKQIQNIKQQQIQQHQNNSIYREQNQIYREQKSIYRPSLIQLQENNKLFLDQSIHRIEPQIINSYIETVYRDYQIPDPLKQNNPQVRNIRAQNNLFVNDPKNIGMPYNENPNNVNIIRRVNTHNENISKTFNQLPEYFIHADRNIRRNNLVSQKQRRKDKKGKQRFLNMTLSKDKNIDSKIFVSPTKHKINRTEDLENNLGNKEGKHHDDKKLNDDTSQKSKSKQHKQGSSHNKISDIKKNISNWKDSQHLFVQRYSYLKSPYQIIQNKSNLGHKGQISRLERQNQKNGGQNSGKNMRAFQSSRNVNVIIRPFQQLMKVNMQHQSVYQLQKDHLTSINKNTTISNLMQSKYHQSFISRQGQIIQEFRYCILCETLILSANIYKHEEKCIGFINERKLYTFKELYQIQKQDQLKNLIKAKIQQIKSRTLEMIENIKRSEDQNKNFSKQVTQSIVSSVENFVAMHTNQQILSQSRVQNFNKSFKKVSQNYQNPYANLMQESNKLHWFVKLLQNHQHRLLQTNKSNDQKAIKTQKVNFSSTRQRKNNNSQSILQEQLSKEKLVSQFTSQVIQ